MSGVREANAASFESIRVTIRNQQKSPGFTVQPIKNNQNTHLLLGNMRDHYYTT
jgi:hypothetical protein